METFMAGYIGFFRRISRDHADEILGNGRTWLDNEILQAMAHNIPVSYKVSDPSKIHHIYMKSLNL